MQDESEFIVRIGDKNRIESNEKSKLTKTVPPTPL